MGKKLKSMDVTIHGVTRSYEFNPAIEVWSDDEGEASLEVLREAETTEVVLTSGAITEARVTVDYEVRFSGSVSLDISGEWEDHEALRDCIESGYVDDIVEGIDDDARDNISDSVTISNIEVDEATDENGEDVDEY